MDRRDLLSGIAGAGLLGAGGAAYALTRGSAGNGTGEDRPFAVEVEALDAPGSESGQLTVPLADRPTLIDLFATWCVPCRAQIESLTALHADYGDRVGFVSVTNERVGETLSRGDVRSWWERHDGGWTVGLDPDSTLMRELTASGLPYLAVVDAAGEVTYTHGGVASRERLAGALEEAL